MPFGHCSSNRVVWLPTCPAGFIKHQIAAKACSASAEFKALQHSLSTTISEKNIVHYGNLVQKPPALPPSPSFPCIKFQVTGKRRWCLEGSRWPQSSASISSISVWVFDVCTHLRKKSSETRYHKKKKTVIETTRWKNATQCWIQGTFELPPSAFPTSCQGEWCEFPPQCVGRYSLTSKIWPPAFSTKYWIATVRRWNGWYTLSGFAGDYHVRVCTHRCLCGCALPSGRMTTLDHLWV